MSTIYSQLFSFVNVLTFVYKKVLRIMWLYSVYRTYFFWTSMVIIWYPLCNWLLSLYFNINPFRLFRRSLSLKLNLSYLLLSGVTALALRNDIALQIQQELWYNENRCEVSLWQCPCVWSHFDCQIRFTYVLFECQHLLWFWSFTVKCACSLQQSMCAVFKDSWRTSCWDSSSVS